MSIAHVIGSFITIVSKAKLTMLISYASRLQELGLPRPDTVATCKQESFQA